MPEVVIISAVRTAIGNYGGVLKDVSAADLGTTVVTEALKRATLTPEDVEEVIMGQALQAGSGQNVARQIVLKAGIPVYVPAYTVNKACASGMKAVTLGFQSIATGESDIVVAGGTESMSAAPFLLPQARWGYGLGSGQLVDSILTDGLTDAIDGCHMGVTAENLAEEFGITRQAQDAFAVESQRKAAQALEGSKFVTEIVPVEVPQKKSPSLFFKTDEFIKPGTNAEILARLKPVFTAKGTVTTGNASGINDGAAAIVLMSAQEARRRDLKPLARIVSFASAGVAPQRMGMGPVPATSKALEKVQVTLADIGLAEINEAFAAQTLAVISELGIAPEIVNVNGGATALGHPIGASGTRIVVTLLHAMADRQVNLGLATLCVGGGQGMALIVERTG